MKGRNEKLFFGRKLLQIFSLSGSFSIEIFFPIVKNLIWSKTKKIKIYLLSDFQKEAKTTHSYTVIYFRCLLVRFIERDQELGDSRFSQSQ